MTVPELLVTLMKIRIRAINILDLDVRQDDTHLTKYENYILNNIY